MKTAVVIGSGFGGIASALRLRRKNYRVQIVEAMPDLGGRARVFEKDGFKFDAGPTVITAPHLLEELFELFGKDMKDYIQLLPVDPFYKVCFHDGREFDYVGDEDRLLAQIEKFNPEDVEGYKKLAEHSRRIFDVGYTQLADQPFLTVADMLKVIPQMISLENYKSVYSLVSKYIKDENLRQVFSFEPLLVGGNPMSITSIYLLIHWLERKWGVHFAKGGTGAIISGLAKLMEEEGIQIHTSFNVDQIETKDGKVAAVVSKDGERIEADIVVSNADPAHVYKNLLPANALSKHRPHKVEKRHASMSLFVPNNTSGLDWKEEGDKYMDKILTHLEKTHMPDLKKNLATSFYITPDYFQGDLQSKDGAAFGLEPRFTQSAYFRYHNRSEDIESLYFVGASTHPGAGVPGVLNSAKVLDKIVPEV